MTLRVSQVQRKIDAPYAAYCETRRSAQQFRSLTTTQPVADGMATRSGDALINFTSNDYLGLSQHPALIAGAQDYAARYGAGATASRLITGNLPPYEVIEDELARGKGCETALIMASGYQANLTVLAAVADAEVIGRNVCVIADRLIHNSLLQGALLSGARLSRYQHNDHEHLETLLRQNSDKNIQSIIVSESVFGMDGDRANLGILTELSTRYGAMLYIDEAHATGLFGKDGFGFCADYAGQVDIVMGTFGKALGSFGAYIACSRTLRDYLLQRCGGVIYSTGLPPSTLGSIAAALDLLPVLQAERDYIQTQAEKVRQKLTAQGWNCGASTTQIIPVLLSDEDAALTLAGELMHDGLLVPAIRPPTVPRGTSRLRISLSAVHRPEAVQKLIEVLASYAPEFATASAQKMAS